MEQVFGDKPVFIPRTASAVRRGHQYGALLLHGAVIQVGARSVRDNFARRLGAKVLLGAAGSLLPDGRK